MDYEKILAKYSSKLSPKKYNLLLNHNQAVLKKAFDVLKKHPGLKVNKRFIKECIMLHDIGTCILPKGTPYIKHGILGREILEKEGYKKHALVCERHIGSGISESEASRLDLPKRDMLPISIEEQLICYVDKFSSKSKDGYHTVPEIKKEMASYGGDQLKRFMDLHKKFS